MREIKFIVVRKEDGVWKRYEPISIIDLWNGFNIGYGTMQKELTNYENGNLVFMQYTGLPDKNGKEIYEGDISDCRMIGTETHVEEVRTKVIYDLTVGAFGHEVVSTGSKYTFLGLNSKYLLECEIIGNVWENKNLLK